MKKEYKSHWFSIQYSPDEYGWYAEIFRRDGTTIEFTDILPDSESAYYEAIAIIDKERTE